jgi:hypothetical protein
MQSIIDRGSQYTLYFYWWIFRFRRIRGMGSRFELYLGLVMLMG